ncbi:MAG: ECF transporter S component [Erysipelotrichaceae bacterium]|nr:ECF transporter S component [Erysipelotrichaceae bacterium]
MNNSIKKITGIAIFTALVIVLQMLGSFIRFGVFSISLVLIPIVVGAALYGPIAGAWLGFVFGMTVLLSGDAAAFLAIKVYATVLVVLLKGSLCGLLSGIVYRLLRKTPIVATILAAVTCPLVNTGVFLIGCLMFFMPTITQWAQGLGFDNAYRYMLVGFVGFNFLFELLTNIILSPVIIRVIRMGSRED